MAVKKTKKVKPIWKVELPNKAYPTPDAHGFPNPVIYRDRLILVTFSPGRVYSILKKTGEIKWAFDLNGFGSPPHIYGNRIFVSTSMTLFALDISTGELLWQFTPYEDKGEWIYAACIRVKNSVFISDRKGLCYRLKMSTGEVEWKTKITKDAEVNAAALVVGNLIVTTTNEATAVGLNAQTGAIEWKSSISDNSTSRVVKFKRNAIISSGPNFSAVNLRSGQSHVFLTLDARFSRTLFVRKNELVGAAWWGSPDWKISRALLFRFNEKYCLKFVEINKRVMNIFTELSSLNVFVLMSSYGFEFFDSELNKIDEIRVAYGVFSGVPDADQNAIYAHTMKGTLVAYPIPNRLRKASRRGQISGRSKSI